MPAHLPTLLAVLALVAAPVGTPAEPLPPRAQALMVLKVLGYDRELPRRVSGAVLVAVASLPGDAAGEARRDEIVAALRGLSKDARARGLPIEAQGVSWRASEGLARAAALVVVGRLAEQAEAIGKVTRAKQILSIGEEPAAVERGLAVAVFSREARPVILASLVSARQEGVAFEPSFLRQAELLEFAAP